VFIGRNSIAAARRFLKAADKAIEMLARMPQMGGLWDSENPALAGLRVWSIRRFESYLIFYRSAADGIEVVRVLHGSRDIDNI
jgi:toxin ParE1/3/4